MSGFGSGTLASDDLRTICQDSPSYHHIFSCHRIVHFPGFLAFPPCPSQVSSVALYLSVLLRLACPVPHSLDVYLSSVLDFMIV